METSRIEELKISYEELKKDAQKIQKKGLPFMMASVIIWSLIFGIQFLNIDVIHRNKTYIPAMKEGTMVNVAQSAILYIESVDKKTFIYTENQVLLTDKRLYELEDILDKRDFFRCSKSTIIHLNKVEKLKP